MYEYRAKIINVVDGDTIDVDIDLGFHITVRQRCRLAGINTPELRDPDPTVRAKGVEAKRFVEAWVAKHQNAAASPGAVTVRSEKPYPDDKYGRYLADVYCLAHPDDTTGLNAALVDEGLATLMKG